MSERVVPTKPGFWWCSFCGNKAVREVYVEESDSPDDPFLAVLDDAGEPWGVFSREIVWLAPVPSVEAVAAVQSKWVDLCRKLEAAGWHPSDVENLNNAIAGLTGGEG